LPDDETARPDLAAAREDFARDALLVARGAGAGKGKARLREAEPGLIGG